MLAAIAIAATIFISIFAAVVFTGVLAGTTEDFANLQIGEVQISTNKTEITNPQSQIVSVVMSDPAVRAVAPIYLSVSNINFTRVGGTAAEYGVVTYGVDPALEVQATTLPSTLTSGSLSVLGPTDVILGEQLASEMGVKPGGVVKMKIPTLTGGYTIKMLEVVGISHHPGLTGFDSDAIINIRTMRSMVGDPLGTTRSTSYIVRIHSSASAQSVRSYIQAWFPKLTVETLDQITASQRATVEQIASFINIIGYIGMVASGIGVITILTMMVTGKTRDIGVLRAMGVQQKEVVEIFVIAGAIIGGIGAVAGSVAGSLMMLYLQFHPTMFIGGLTLVISFSPRALATPVAIGLSISLLAAIYPAWRAARYRPAEAMRYF